MTLVTTTITMINVDDELPPSPSDSPSPSSPSFSPWSSPLSPSTGMSVGVFTSYISAHPTRAFIGDVFPYRSDCDMCSRKSKCCETVHVFLWSALLFVCTFTTPPHKRKKKIVELNGYSQLQYLELG